MDGWNQILYSLHCLTTETEKYVNESYIVNLAALKHSVGDYRELEEVQCLRLPRFCPLSKHPPVPDPVDTLALAKMTDSLIVQYHLNLTKLTVKDKVRDLGSRKSSLNYLSLLAVNVKSHHQ